LAALGVLLGLAALAADAEAPGTDIAALSKVGCSSSPVISPDGNRIAFVSDASGSPQAWLTPVMGGWPARLTITPDSVVGVSWSPAGDLLAFTADPGSGGRQIYVIRPDGTGLRRVTTGGAEWNQWGGWSGDGTLFAFSSDRRGNGSMDVYLYDVRNGEARLAIRSEAAGAITDIGEDGAEAVMIRTGADGDHQLSIVDPRDGSGVSLISVPAPARIGPGFFAAEEGAVYFVTDAGHDFAGLAAVRLDEERNPGPLEWVRTREEAGLEELAISEDGATAALVWNSGARSEVELLDLESGESELVEKLPQPVASGVTLSSDGGLLAMTLTGSSAPREVWLLDRGTGELRQLTQSPRDGVNLASLVVPEKVGIRSHDGLELSGWLYRATPDGARGPLVISFHDGPESEERPVFRRDYQALLANGISVFAPNVRGSSGFGRDFAELDNGSLRENAIRDVAASVDYVVREGIADPGRIGVMGTGYGGYLAMAGLTEYPDLFAAGVVISGMFDLESVAGSLKPWAAGDWKREYGDPETQEDMLRALSPARRISRVSAPVLFLHGANDELVPPVEVEALVDALRADSVPAEHVVFEGAGRHLFKTADRVRATNEIVEWFERLRQ